MVYWYSYLPVESILTLKLTASGKLEKYGPEITRLDSGKIPKYQNLHILGTLFKMFEWQWKIYIVLRWKKNPFPGNKHGFSSAILQELWFSSLWPSDAIWQHRYVSTLAYVMACCLIYLNQCWLLISEVLRHPPESNFIVNVQCELLFYITSLKMMLLIKITSTSLRGQWINALSCYVCVPVCVIVPPLLLLLQPWLLKWQGNAANRRLSRWPCSE